MPNVVRATRCAFSTNQATATEEDLRIGLSLPGHRRPGVRVQPRLADHTRWDGCRCRPYFAELTDAPVILDNDANVIALANGGAIGRPSTICW